MPLNLLILLATTLVNVFKNPVTAATATSGIGAGAVIALERPPQTTLDWVIVIAGTVGMVANALHANLVAQATKTE